MDELEIKNAPYFFERLRRKERIYRGDVSTFFYNDTGATGSIAFACPAIQLGIGLGVASANDWVVFGEGGPSSAAQFSDIPGITRVGNAGKAFWARSHIVDAHMSIDALTNPAVDPSYTGIGLGAFTFGTTSTAWATDKTKTVVQLRAAMKASGAHEWQLITAPGDGTTNPTIVVLTGVNAPARNRTAHVMLIYQPGLAAAYVDGQLGATQTNTALMPPQTTDVATALPACCANIFIANGGPGVTQFETTFALWNVETMGRP